MPGVSGHPITRKTYPSSDVLRHEDVALRQTGAPRSEKNTLAGASDDGDSASFWKRYEHAKYNDVTKNVLIEDLISRYDHLMRTHDEYVESHPRRNHVEAHPDREYVKNLEAQLQQRTSECAHLQHIMNQDPFFLVLLDGDSMVFSLLNQGETGGTQAAKLLHKAVIQWAANNVGDCPSDVKVIARVYANFNRLAELLTRAGVADAPAKVEGFVRGFSYECLLFDFVDVGAAANCARGKVSENFDLFLYNYHCRQIIIGCGNDTRYVKLLEECTDDEEAQSRVTLLEGSPFNKDFDDLSLRKTNFSGIFRNKPSASLQTNLIAEPGSRIEPRSALNATSGVFTPRNDTPNGIYSPPAGAASMNGTTPIEHLRTDSIASSDAGAATGWSAVAKKNAHRPLIDTTRPPAVPEPIKRNRAGQRIDTELDYDREEVQRVKKLKACNQHYIGVGCCHFNAGRTDKCPHHHNYNFSNQDLKTLRVVARETPCKTGHECDNIKCIYGHQCPFPLAMEGSMRGIGCLNGESCRFPKSMHGMDLNPSRMTRVTGAF